MNLDLPPNLHATRNLLAGSLQLHATEQAPPVPAHMLSDLVNRFDSAPITATSVQSHSWFAAVQSFIARPAFGMAALAIVILGISVPRMIDSATRTSGGFRGATPIPAQAQNLRIILIQSPAGFQQTLKDAGDFESSMISSATNTDGITGPRILVDFVTSTITALNASNETIYTAPLPKDAKEISAAIAKAISRL